MANNNGVILKNESDSEWVAPIVRSILARLKGKDEEMKVKLKTKDDELKAKEAQIMANDTELRAKDAQLKAKTAEAESLRRRLGDALAENHHLREALEDQEARADNLEAVMEQKVIKSEAAAGTTSRNNVSTTEPLREMRLVIVDCSGPVKEEVEEFVDEQEITQRSSRKRQNSDSTESEEKKRKRARGKGKGKSSNPTLEIGEAGETGSTAPQGSVPSPEATPNAGTSPTPGERRSLRSSSRQPERPPSQSKENGLSTTKTRSKMSTDTEKSSLDSTEEEGTPSDACDDNEATDYDDEYDGSGSEYDDEAEGEGADSESDSTSSSESDSGSESESGPSKVFDLRTAIFLEEKGVSFGAIGNGTSLSTACEEGDLDLVKVLIKCGDNMNKTNDNGCTPLAVAICYEENHDIARILLKHGADVDCTITGSGGCCGGDDPYAGLTPLMAACYDVKYEVVKLLLKHGAKVNLRSAYAKLTPLMLSCIEHDYNDTITHEDRQRVVRFLIKNGAEIEAEAGNGKTALFFACETGMEETVGYLLAKGADVKKTLRDGTTLFDVVEDNSAIEELLLEYGAEDDEEE